MGRVSGKQWWGCQATPLPFPLSLFGFSSWTGRPEPRPAERERTGATPLFDRWRGSAREGCQPRCQAPCQTPPPPSGGSLPSSCILAGRLPGPHAGRTTSRDASAGWFLLTGGGMSSWCGWHWPAVFPVEDPVAVLVHCRTPNLYRAVVAWQCVSASCRGLYRGAGDDCRLSHPVRQTGRRTAAPRAGRSRLTTTRPLARYRQDEKRPPARSPRQGSRPNRPSGVGGARTGRSAHRRLRSDSSPCAPAPPR